MATLFDLIDRPRKAFSHVIDHPKSFWTPAILVILSIIVLAVVNLQSTATLVSARFAQFANSTPGSSAFGQQSSASNSGTRTFNRQGATAGQTPQPGQAVQGTLPAGAPGLQASTSILTPVIGIIFLIIAWFVIAVLGHFLGRLFGGTNRFTAIFAVSVWTSLPFFLRNVTQIAFQLLTKRTILYQGLSFLAPVGAGFRASGGFLYTLLASIDPFAIWFLVLLAIGLSVATKIKGWKAALIAVFIFTVLVGARLVPVLFGLAIRIPVLG